MERISIFILIIILSSCKSNKYNNVLGNWNVVHIYENKKDFLKNDIDKKVYFYPPMYIEKHISLLTIELSRDKDMFSKFEILSENNNNFLILSESNINLYDGKYSIKITDSISKSTGKKINYLFLESNDVKIVATRSARVLKPL